MTTDTSYAAVKLSDPDSYQQIVAFTSTVDLLENATRANIESFMMTLFNKAFELGRQEGYDTGYDEGNTEGNSEGYDVGYESGYESGIDESSESAYDEGFNDGTASKAEAN
tara:strand:- start:1773 stop:2105 length:333 start_codon:yes stop_codon:yes gene_type:complete